MFPYPSSNLFNVYILDPPWGYTSHYNGTWNSINFTWHNGNHSDRTVIVRQNSTANVNSPIEGYEVYNGTNTWFNETVTVGNIRSYTAFSYNITTHSYSEKLNMLWGALNISVYNASQTWQEVEPFGLLIQNQAGTQTYLNQSCYTPMTLDINDIPVGSNTIFKINSTRYQTQTYTRSTVANSFYNYTFLLPPVSTGPSGTQNDTYIYQITIIDQYSNPVPDALVVINEYRNATDTYEQVYSFLTDGAGQVNPWLSPNFLYQIIITKTGYTDATNYWTPSAAVFVKTFMIYYIEPANTTSYIFGDKITTSGYLDNATSTLYILYDDNLSQTENCQIYVYEINKSNASLTLIYTFTTTTLNSFQVTKLVQNKSNNFLVVFHINHTYFGYHSWSFVIQGYNLGGGVTITTMNKFNLLFIMNFGWCPVGWSNLITWFIILGVFFSFERRDTWIIMFIIGFLILFINYYIGFNTSMALFAGGAIPIVIIFFGILMLIRDRKRWGVDF